MDLSERGMCVAPQRGQWLDSPRGVHRPAVFRDGRLDRRGWRGWRAAPLIATAGAAGADDGRTAMASAYCKYV